MQVKKDIAWINWTKTICIILVYLYHSEIYCGHALQLARCVYEPFFVNTFFFISGYLLFRKQLSTPIKDERRCIWVRSGGGILLILNILYRIVLPSILFSTLIYFPKMLIRGQEISLIDFLHDTIGGGSAWFTSALAVAELIIFLLLMKRSRNIWYYIVISALVACVGCWLYNKEVLIFGDKTFPWFYKSGMMATFIMVLGGVYQEYESSLEKLFSKRKTIFLFMGITFYFCAAFALKGHIHTALDSRAFNLSGLLMIVISSLLIISLCKYLHSSILSLWIGRHSLGLYLICGAVPNVYGILLKKIMPDNIGLPLLCTILSFATAVVVVYFIDRWVPFCYNFNLLRKND